MRNRSQLFLLIIFFFAIGTVLSQTEVSGVVKDENTGEPLIGAIISCDSSAGVTTDLDGNFSLKVTNGSHVLIVAFTGYESQRFKIKANGSKISLLVKLMSVQLDEVEVVASVGTIRETPVAMTTISNQKIAEELGNRDLPMVLNSTPGVYASQQGGGAGDARVNIRGFDQRYVAVLVDGVPVNDMENGQVYWSNWSGLSEVTKTLQVQRGLGASRLAVPSVGGTMNIITSSIEDKKYFIFKNDYGSNNYGRWLLGYNSGMIKGKYGFTLSASYTTGQGWVERTWQSTWSYFAKFTYRFNSRSFLTFGVNGAPQSHGQRTSSMNMGIYDENFAKQQGVNTDSLYSAPGTAYTNSINRARGLQYNPDWGYVNGKAVNTRMNFFHKPLFNLSHFWTASDRITLSNVLYFSMGRGGGTGMFNSPSIDKAGEGQLMLQSTYNTNSNAAPNFFTGLKQATSYIYASINNHDWIGSLSTLKMKVNPKLNIIAGVDLRYYEGIHYQTPYNLLGGDYTQEGAGKNKLLAPFIKDPNSYTRKLGDKLNYHYKSRNGWTGLFGQAEFKTKKISSFLTLTANGTWMQNINYFGKKDVVIDKDNIVYNAIGYGDTLYSDGQNVGVISNPYGLPNVSGIVNNPNGSITFKDQMTQQYVTIQQGYTTYNINSSQSRTNTTAWKFFTGTTIKTGFNYKINEQHNVFVNTGYMSLAPRYSNVFDRSGVELRDVKNQNIISFELGYGVKTKYLALNLNAYRTSWGNKPLDFPLAYTDPTSGQIYYYNIPGIDALMKGIELDYTVQLMEKLKLEGSAMLCDWRWASGGVSYVFTDGGAILDTITFDATNVHMGNAPMRQLTGSLRWEPFKGFYIKPQWVWFGDMYAQFDPSALRIVKSGNTVKDYRGLDSWKMPSYHLLDLYLGYKRKIGACEATFTAGINNVLNVVYLTDASFTASGITPDKYVPSIANAYMGLGRRFNIGAKITF